MAVYSIYKFIYIILTFAGSSLARYRNDDIDLKFPDNFLIGTATSSYQIEGAWNISDKSSNIWDHVVHNYPWRIADQSNGDIACDSYHRYTEDADLLQNIGVDHYRFSISWARILPNGYPTYISKDGIQYYHNLLDELEKRGIIPIVTLYHWDHPQSLEQIGGWLNEEMAFLFAEYARIIFNEYGPRVKYFVTVNEPSVICHFGYTEGTLSLGGDQWAATGTYRCVHNMIKAHALAYRIYDNEFRHKQNGFISLAIPVQYAFSKNKDDITSPDVAFEFRCGWIANPIFSEKGDYPEIMKQQVAEISRLQGYNSSKLPTFSQDWIELIRGSADYFGLNHYSSDIIEPLPESEKANWKSDEGFLATKDPAWPSSEDSWLRVVPEGFGSLLRKIKSQYNNPPVFILENGVSDGSSVNDDFRINYLYSYMREMLIAIKVDNCNVQAYTLWSLLDNFEWNKGYTSHFGIVEVDMNDRNRTRTLKKSAKWLKAVIKARELLPPDSEHLFSEEK